jgi:hypothetical protein
VRVDSATVTEEGLILKGGEVVQVGKRRFFKLEAK